MCWPLLRAYDNAFYSEAEKDITEDIVGFYNCV